MAYIQLITALFGFGAQLLRWMNKAEERDRSVKVKCEKLKKFKKALQSAEKGETNELEQMFAILRPYDNKSELSDKA
jgi:Sec7-like guanine-nucleotide exchange factor